MKGITLCAECAYYSTKKHKCTRGATDEGEPTARFYADCPLPEVAPTDGHDSADTPHPNANEWISVEERLPEHKQKVLCFCQAGIWDVLTWDYVEWAWIKDSKHAYMQGFITYWMPLPEPPKNRVKDIST